tara:strand:- start:14043 stop:14216 length:174 start_codon:yes stop_codon:yes gene_type:complete
MLLKNGQGSLVQDPQKPDVVKVNLVAQRILALSQRPLLVAQVPRELVFKAVAEEGDE